MRTRSLALPARSVTWMLPTARHGNKRECMCAQEGCDTPSAAGGETGGRIAGEDEGDIGRREGWTWRI